MEEIFEEIISAITKAGGCDGSCEYDKGYDDAISQAISAAETVISKCNNGWIPVSERMRMSEFKSCEKCVYVNEKKDGEHCGKCVYNATDQFVHMTNADKIRNMTDDELADFLGEHFICEDCVVDDCKNDNCEGTMLKWLRKKVI